MKTTWLAPLLSGFALACSATESGVEAPDAAREGPPVATLGVRSAAPTDEQARSLGLEHNVRYRGQVVEEVLEGSPASTAGLRPGDALLRLDDNELYSQDDIADFLRVSEPGREVEVTFVREGSPDPHTATIRLGSGPGEIPDGPRFEWQYASLAQLPAALDEARTSNKKLLVGLSGAET